MLESVITVSITVSSVLLFCYWFRYTCRLILSAATSQDYATSVAQAHQLGFQNVALGLRSGATDLNGLKEMLDLDYAVLARLMDRAGDAQSGVERHMLATHYRLASAWYRAGSSISASAARTALEEMAMVVAHFANSVGEHAACVAAA